MKAGGQDGEARVLARFEAELRESDPQLSALFDKLDVAGRGLRPHPRPAGTQWARLLAALLTVLALVLTALLPGGHGAEWQDCPVLGCPGITAFADRAAGMVQAHTADLGREIRAELCQSIPVSKSTSACG